MLCAGEARGLVLNLGNAEDLTAALKNWYPGITFQRKRKGDERDRVIRIVCGAPMTIGDSPRDAAEAWLGQFAEVFGVTEPELEFAWERPMRERQDWKVSKTVLRYRQAEVKMELLDSGGTTVLYTAFTDESGDYMLTAPSSGTYKVRATLAGRNWTVVHWDGCGSGDPEPVRLGPVDVTAGSTGVDFEFGSSSATAHEIVRELVDYWDDPMSEDPIDEPFLVWTEDDNGSNAGGAFYLTPSGTCPAILSFGAGVPSAGEYVHWATPTIVAHEFGHLVEYAYEVVEFPTQWGVNNVFAEGYSDATALVFLQDAPGSIPLTIIGPDTKAGGCGYHLRDPMGFDPCYIVCFLSGFSSEWYLNGLLLAALWMDTRAELGYSSTCDLFAAWSFLAVAPGIAVEDCQPCHIIGQPNPHGYDPCFPDESAAPSTLIQVLTADDDDGDLTNGTPNDAALCAIFAARNIAPDIDIGICEVPPYCEESAVGAGHGAWPCDVDQAPTALGMLCFWNLLISDSKATDLNGDGRLDLMDVQVFVLRRASVIWKQETKAWLPADVHPACVV